MHYLIDKSNPATVEYAIKQNQAGINQLLLKLYITQTIYKSTEMDASFKVFTSNQRRIQKAASSEAETQKYQQLSRFALQKLEEYCSIDTKAPVTFSKYPVLAKSLEDDILLNIFSFLADASSRRKEGMISQTVGLCCKRFYNLRRLKEFKQLNKFNNKIHFTHGELFHVLKDNDRIDIRAPNGKYRKGIIVRKYVQNDDKNSGTASSSANNSGTAGNLTVSTSNGATIYTVSPPGTPPPPNGGTGSASSSGQFNAAIGDDSKDGEHRLAIQNNKSNKNNNQIIQIQVKIDIFERKEEAMYIDPLFTIQSHKQSNRYQITKHGLISKRPNLSYERKIVPHLRAHRKKDKDKSSGGLTLPAKSKYMPFDVKPYNCEVMFQSNLTKKWRKLGVFRNFEDENEQKNEQKSEHKNNHKNKKRNRHNKHYNAYQQSGWICGFFNLERWKNDLYTLERDINYDANGLFFDLPYNSGMIPITLDITDTITKSVDRKGFPGIDECVSGVYIDEERFPGRYLFDYWVHCDNEDVCDQCLFHPALVVAICWLVWFVFFFFLYFVYLPCKHNSKKAKSVCHVHQLAFGKLCCNFWKIFTERFLFCLFWIFLDIFPHFSNNHK